MANEDRGAMREERQRLLNSVKDIKARIETELKRYKSAVTNLRTLISAYEVAYTGYVRRPNDKNDKKVDETRERVESYDEIRRTLASRITALRAMLSSAVNSLITALGEGSPRAEQTRESETKFNESVTNRILQLEAGLEERLSAVREVEEDAIQEGEDFDVLPIIDAPEEAEPVLEPEVDLPTQPSTANSAPIVTSSTPVSATATSINVAPVNLDVTPMIERAISAAIEQLSAGLEVKLRDYINGINIPAVSSPALVNDAPPAPIVVSDSGVVEVSPPATAAELGAIGELSHHIAEGEREAYSKLREICESVDALLAEVSEISARYATLTEKMNEITESQRLVNDIQRQTMRDQQGIQVAQRLISDEQIELTTQQSLTRDKQGEASAAQSELTAIQSGTLEATLALIEKQREIEASLAEFTELQRQTMQAIARLGQTQNTIAQKQGEVATMQRETMATQRVVERAQRSVGARTAKGRSKKDEEPTDDGALGGIEN